MKTKTITIKVPEKLRSAFKMSALRQNKTMTEILLGCIRRHVKKDLKGNKKC